MKRKILAFVLKLLSKWAIKKHDMKIIVVAGKHGTKITGELISGMLEPDYTVRKQLEVSFWDFSIPLAILGLEDRRYNVIQWTGLIFAALFRLLLGNSNFTWTILQMNTFKEDIAHYWLDILEPEITTFVNIEDNPRKLESLLTKKTKQQVVFAAELDNIQHLLKGAKANITVVGKDPDSDLVLKFMKELDTGIALTLQNNDKDIMEFFAFQTGHFMINPILAAVATLIAMDFSAEEVQERLVRTEIDLERFLLNTV